jgi:hypothetical protein
VATEEIQPTTINAIQGMVPKAYALLAGMQFDLFTALQDGPLSVDELARTVGGDRRRLSALLYYLVPPRRVYGDPESTPGQSSVTTSSVQLGISKLFSAIMN